MLPEANTVPLVVTGGLAWPLRAIDSSGATVGLCHRITGNSAEFVVDRDCRVTKITEYDGHIQHACNHPIRKGQLLVWALNFASSPGLRGSSYSEP